ncbi:MAG: 2Fe-2S iron-sulfur cluster-binding protein [Coriobacteriales bacterium]|nr:2Fe-2S iron-sulfur cluster-binding protein [Coriobacteriales bacterium]
MKKLIDVLRRSSAMESPWHQVFEYEVGDERDTVATALREINLRDALVDVDGRVAKPICWECSCLQKKCGACAMVVEGVPRLACDARLSGFRHQTIHLEPLRKFPVVADLKVDRARMFENLKEARVWLEGESELREKRRDIAYEASRCLQCGCCLEVCPNFNPRDAFGGMSTMVPLARLLSEASPEQRAQLKEAYREKVYGGCGKSLACRNICPAEIDIDKLLSRSNAAAVWGRF